MELELSYKTCHDWQKNLLSLHYKLFFIKLFQFPRTWQHPESHPLTFFEIHWHIYWQNISTIMQISLCGMWLKRRYPLDELQTSQTTVIFCGKLLLFFIYLSFLDRMSCCVAVEAALFALWEVWMWEDVMISSSR